MLKKISFFVLLIVAIPFSGCEVKNTDTTSLKISLEKQVGNTNVFDYRYTDFHFTSNYRKHPRFYAHLKGSFKKIPVFDTALISQHITDNRRFWYMLLKKGFSKDSNLAKRLEGVNTDSLGFDIEVDNALTLVTGIKNGQQLVIVDVNKNNSFDADEVQVFPKGFSENPEQDSIFFNSLPLIDYSYEIYALKNIDTYKRKAIIYPFKNHDYTFSYFGDSLNKKIHVMGKLKDYWQGELQVSNKKYNILCQGFNKEYLQILIKPDSVKLDQKDYIKNKKFEYAIRDTFSLSNSKFVIDSFTPSSSELILRKLNLEHQYFGFRQGETIKDLELMDLKGKTFTISESKQDSKYILLDFWGTWCPPCLETTPLLQEIHMKYSKNLKIISLAYDNSSEEVFSYTTENSMVWPQAFIERIGDPNSIVQKLRIDYFPTFLLLDEKLRIVKRSIGMEGLREIEAYLTKKTLD